MVLLMTISTCYGTTGRAPELSESLPFYFFLLSTFSLAQIVANIFINAGGSFASNGYRCDVPSLWRSSLHKYSSTRPVQTNENECTDHYKSHASVFTGHLVYTIPILSGSYTVDLMF